MLRYALRTVPWTHLALIALTLGALLEVVRRWPWTMWPLQACAVGLVAAAGAWCLDEPAAAVVDAAPRSLLWRTAARAIAQTTVLVVWFALVWWSRDSFFGHAPDVALQGFSALVFLSAVVTGARSIGAATPSRTAAAAVVPIAAFLGLARPLAKQVPIFPYGPDADWELSRGIWATLLAAGLVVGFAAVGDARWSLIRPACSAHTHQARPRPARHLTSGAEADSNSPSVTRCPGQFDAPSGHAPAADRGLSQTRCTSHSVLQQNPASETVRAEPP